MSLPNERRASGVILRETRYHRAAVKADPETEHLAERIEGGERELRVALEAHEAAKDARVEAQARMVRADYAIDFRTRQVELQVLAAVVRDRSTPAYRACFPKGLSDVIAMRGAEQERATRSLVEALEARFPELAAAHGAPLLGLAETAHTAERAWQEAARLAAIASGTERLARLEVIRTMQRNVGALAELFPGDKRRARSYFVEDRRVTTSVEPRPEE